MKSPIKNIIITFILVSQIFGARHAILIGNSSGTRNLANLKYVKNDINAVKEILSSNCSFNEQNIHTLYNKTPLEVKSILQKIKPKISSSEKDLLFFYYSGHADNNSLIMGMDRYPLSELKKNIKSIPSSMKILVFDACQSGSFARLKGGSIDSPFLLHEDNNIEGQVVLYSSSASEYSQESDYYRQSIFSFHLVNALKGCADASGDMQVTLNEAYQYAYGQTVASTINSVGGIQHPGYLLNIQGKGNVVLADMRSNHNGIVLDKEIKGSIAVLDPAKNIISDIIKKDSTEMFIALNSGKFTVYNNYENRASKVKVNLTGNTIHHLKGSQFKSIRSMPVYSKGGSGKKIKLSVIPQFGFSLIDNSSLQNSLKNRYSYLKEFNISPNLQFKEEQWQAGIGSELEFLNGIFIYLNYGYSKESNNAETQGSTTTPHDSAEFPVSLKIENILHTNEINFGIGYSFRHNALKFFSVATGIDIPIVKLNTNSFYTESLYQISTKSESDEKGVLILPSIKAIFEYPFSSIFSLGTSVKYRFQLSTSGLLSQDDSLEYNLGGLSAMIRLKFTLNDR